jgi:hypothetical protein
VSDTIEYGEIVVTARLTSENRFSDWRGGGGGSFESWTSLPWVFSYGSYIFDQLALPMELQQPVEPEPNRGVPLSELTDLEQLRVLDILDTPGLALVTLPNGNPMAIVDTPGGAERYYFGFDQNGDSILRGITPGWNPSYGREQVPSVSDLWV